MPVTFLSTKRDTREKPDGRGKKTKKQPSPRNRGRYQKGQSGNPTGRPPGSRNKATRIAEALLDGEAEALIRKAIELAKSGDRHALQLCFSRILAPRRSRPVTFDLPTIESPADLVAAHNAVLKAVSAGELTLEEAEQTSNLLDVMRQAMETAELAADIEALKEREGWVDVN